MYPSQDVASSIGNLIALPLQGQALKNGNSAFVDENWNAYPDQWDALFNKTRKLGIEDVEQCMAKWQGELAEVRGMLTNIEKNVRPKPWKKKCEFCKSDVVGKLHMVLGNGVYVDTLNLMPRIQNQIRSLAAFDNPEFYKNKRLGYSNYYNFSAVYLGKDIDGYIQIPRGLRENIIQECEKAGISVDVSDQRETGQPIRVSFKGDLRMQQELAAEKLLSHSDGVLSAATAFGKTVVCSYLIAERKVNTLILLQSKDLLNQWVDELNHFLEIREEPPEYETKTGRKKKRNSVIGVLHGNKNTLTGIIDVAMVGSMYSRGKFNERINYYGMVIMDECHHAASNTSMELLQKINAKYVYGVSATPKRGDSLDRIIYMLLGPLRHRFTALERAKEQGIGHYFVPRYTRVVDTAESKDNINKAYNLISTSKVRNEMIIDDVITCVARKQTPVILTRFKDIMSANINALLDKCEDPEKMIDQYMRNLESDLGKVKAETASVMAEETRAKRELDECTEQINKMQAYAEKALKAGNESDARSFLEKKQQLATTQAALTQAYNVAADNAAKMRQMHDKLVKDISSLEARRTAIKATVKAAKAQERINKVGSSVVGASNSMDAFNKMEAKANKMLDEANAMAELNASAEDSNIDNLAAKYDAEPANTAVDDELAALKAQMGIE